jgi:putative oxidoreductase
MERVLGRYYGEIYAIFRIVVGFLFMVHGTQKLFGLPTGQGGGGSLPPLMVTAGVIELIAGILIMIGFYAAIAAFIASGEMAVAYFMSHQPKGALPIQNQGELAALYAFVFLYIAARGSGPWSVDSAFRGRSPAEDAA